MHCELVELHFLEHIKRDVGKEINWTWSNQKQATTQHSQINNKDPKNQIPTIKKLILGCLPHDLNEKWFSFFGMKTKTHFAILLLFKSCPLILPPPNKRESGGDAKPKKLRLKFFIA